MYTYVYLISSVFRDNKQYYCFEGSRNQQYVVFWIIFLFKPKRLGYEVNLGSGLEFFLYWRSLWALWLTPWEFAGDLVRRSPLHVHRIFRWKKQRLFEWRIDSNRFRDYAVLTGHSHWYLIPNPDMIILFRFTVTKLLTVLNLKRNHRIFVSNFGSW